MIRIRASLRASLVATASVVLACASNQATATQVTGPSRPLTGSERLSYDTALATAICEARIVRLVDTVIVDPLALRPHRTHHVFLVFEPIRWLKGDGAHRIQSAGRTITHPPLFDEVRAVRGPGAKVLLFLVPYPAMLSQISIDPKWPYPVKPSWAVSDSPLGVPPKEQLLSGASGRKMLGRAQEEVEQQSLAGMVRGADVVVVARPDPAPSIKRDGMIFCPIVVDSVLTGSSAGRRIEVGAVFPFDLPNGPAILFLKRDESGRLVVSKPIVGHAPIREGTVSRFGSTLERVAAEVRRLSRREVR